MQKRKPKLGQNFLIDDEARHRIADALGDVTAKTVIEIGPGHGAITEILAARARRLICIELDEHLASELRFKFRDHPNVEVAKGDVLKAEFPFLLAPDTAKASVVGNLPYYITSDILLALFANCHLFDRAVLMMQREVADRVAAAPGVREYGLLTATTQMYAQVASLFTLPPSAFSPPPDVFSSVVRLEFASRFTELAVDAPGFDTFLKQSFGQKRKTLANNLRAANFSRDLLENSWPAQVPREARAEALTLQQMAAVYRALHPAAPTPSS
ncbi:MAG TPA: 16S rRNA (adenine(1518)-N(6)/adenine(1519)-N(6))-dimethyltransferase RsmA [Acidobacteriaceae bacterium]